LLECWRHCRTLCERYCVQRNYRGHSAHPLVTDPLVEKVPHPKRFSLTAEPAEDAEKDHTFLGVPATRILQSPQAFSPSLPHRRSYRRCLCALCDLCGEKSGLILLHFKEIRNRQACKGVESSAGQHRVNSRLTSSDRRERSDGGQTGIRVSDGQAFDVPSGRSCVRPLRGRTPAEPVPGLATRASPQ
jgi:hypothetical protein